MASEKIQLELKSPPHNSHLLSGTFIPSKDYAEIEIRVVSFGGFRLDQLNEDAAGAEIELVLSYMKVLKGSLKKISIRLPYFGISGYQTNSNDKTILRRCAFYASIVTPLLKALKEELPISRVGIIVSDSTPAQWWILRQQPCLDVITDLELYHATSPLGPMENNILNAMSQLSRLEIMEPDFHFGAPTTAEPTILSLAQVNFSGTLNSISVDSICSPEEARGLLALLGRNPQVKHIHLKRGTHISELTNLICLHHLETLKIGFWGASFGSNFVSALVSAITKSISSQLKVLDLSFDTDYATYEELDHLESQLQNLKNKLMAAMDQNKNAMRLESFKLTFAREADSDSLEIMQLQMACSMFAAKKKILRATLSGPNSVPHAALPAAAMAIKSHPLINQDWGFCSMVFGYLKNNPDIIERALEQQKSGGSEENK